jgi:hypothetical protein
LSGYDIDREKARKLAARGVFVQPESPRASVWCNRSKGVSANLFCLIRAARVTIPQIVFRERR